jgi:hypothetical protein
MMILPGWDGIGWLLLMLGPLLIFQRALHREIQAVLLLATRRADVSLALFSLIFFPGVLLHEVSHLVTAKLLRVRTGRLSLFPRPLADGRLQLGYVDVASSDIVRDALIGLAPLVTGLLVIGYIGLGRMNLLQAGNSLIGGDLNAFVQQLGELPGLPDFWVWFYLAFAVSSTMFPSASDRRAWLPLLLITALLAGLALLAGAGPWLVQNLAPRLNGGLRVVAAVFATSLGIHLMLFLPFFGLRLLLSRITGYRVL